MKPELTKQNKTKQNAQLKLLTLLRGGGEPQCRHVTGRRDEREGGSCKSKQQKV
jgi:hypothetical protein